MKQGEQILLDDGRLALRVLGVEDRDVRCRVVDGGRLSNHKGMNLPDSALSAAALTPKDRRDVAFGKLEGLDLLPQRLLQLRHGFLLDGMMQSPQKDWGSPVPQVLKQRG